VTKVALKACMGFI